jgi:MFS transporter, CP family, cyanate transporter
VPGAILTNRWGARRVIGILTVGIGIGALIRLLPPAPVALFVGTLVLSACVAMCQPAASSLIRAWFPGSVQRTSVLYTIALNLGGVAATTTTVYLVTFGGWRGTFAIWAVPALLAGAAWMLLAPRRPETLTQPPHLRSLLHDPGVWHAAGLFAAQSLVYFTATTWLPFLLQPSGRQAVALVLLLMGLSVIISSVGLALLRRPFATSRTFYALAGTLSGSGAIGLLIGAQDAAWLWAMLLGLGSGLAFTGSMALPPLIAPAAAVAAYSALMLTAGYGLAFIGPYAGGLLVDATGSLRAPFAILVLAALAIILLGLTLPRQPSQSVDSAT